MLLHGWALVAGPRLILVFTGGKGSVHEEHVECILSLFLRRLSPTLSCYEKLPTAQRCKRGVLSRALQLIQFSFC